MDLHALMEGVRTGAVNGIMFPHDVVANAPRSSATSRRSSRRSRASSSSADGEARLAAIVTGSLGVIIEIPGNIAILA